MGKALFEVYPSYRQALLDLDEIAQVELGRSLISVIFDSSKSRSDSFDRLLFTHPSLYLVQYALVETLRRHDVLPDLLLGTSLGAYIAASVAGCLSPAEAVRLLVRQARLLEEVSSRRGGMVAVLADPIVYELHAELHENSEVAGINFDSHFVLSAPSETLPHVEEFLRRSNIAFHRLPVAFPFHSRWMDALEAPLRQQLDAIGSHRANIPLISCSDCHETDSITPEFLWRAGRCPIRFRDTVRFLERRGAHEYVDLGPSGTLATFLKYCLQRESRSKNVSILSPFGDEAARLKSFLSEKRVAG